jgi:hypothetical protein
MAGNSKDTPSQRDSQTLVGDLLRRATSPEVLAGVAGAAAAARFTKHLVEDPDETEADELPEQGEADEAHAAAEDEPDDDEDEAHDGEHEEPRAEEDEAHEDEVDEDESESDDEEEVPEAAAEPESDEDEDADPPQDEEAEDDQETSASSGSSNGAVGSDDERMELLDQARRYAEQLTGHSVESFSSLEQDERGWRIGVEVVELSRVPSTTDVLGSYELVLSDEGEFVDFRRAHRYYRNSTDDTSS